MSIVQGKDVLLKIYKDGIENAIACNASCTMSIDTDYFESSFYNTGRFRKWIPNKHTAVLNGSGPIFLGEPITIADVIGWQLNRTLVEFNFVLTGGTDILRIHGFGYFIKSSVDGTIGQAATCDYTIQVNGEPVMYATNSNPSSDDDRVWDYDAEGGETSIGYPDLMGSDIVYVAREGVGIKVITEGIPSGSQVLFNKPDGTLTFGTPLLHMGDRGEWIHVIYQVPA